MARIFVVKFPTPIRPTHIIMTEHQIKLVKKSWLQFRRIKPALVADTFYSHLFFLHPELRNLFPKDMAEQYEKLISMLNTVVARLEKKETLQNIAEMGERHKGYGVKTAHYNYVGQSLLWTLEKGLGNDWNDETAEAWRDCYTILSSTMIDGTK